MADAIREKLFVADSARPMEEVCAALEASIPEHGFGLLHVHDVRAKMASKGVDFDRPVKIFDVCNPHKAKQVLEKNILISPALPCAISVFREGDGTRISFIRPTVMLEMFGEADLRPIAEEVEETMRAIVEAAVR
jgi:uncharacterized protein (DUF302 family)